MKKTINVNLSGRIFYIEDDAYAELDRYLTEVKQHFSKFEDSAEILADIEARIAEQLLEHTKEPNPIISLPAVQQVVSSMGKPSDFTDAENGLKEKQTHAENTPHVEGPRRFYRNGDDHILGGVASGIASYFDIDPLWVRLLFVLSTFLGGYGILIYIVLWIIVPKATTLSEKLEMNGNRITLESLEKSIKEKIIHNPKTTQGMQQAAEAFRPAAAKARTGARAILQILFQAIGLAFTLAATAGLIGLVIAGTAFITGSTSAYTEFPLRDFLGLPQFYGVLCAIFFVAFVPLLVLLLAGLSLLALKSRFSRPVLIALIVLWVTAACVLAGLAARNAPRFETFTQNQPAYQLHTQERTLPAFAKLEVRNGLDIQVIQGPEVRLSVTALERDQDRIKSEVVNNTLTIEKQNKKTGAWCFFCKEARSSLVLTVPTLTDVCLENGTVLENKTLAVPTLTITTLNASRAIFESLTTENIHIDTRNASSVIVSGKSTTLTATAQNASRIQADALLTTNATATAQNASRITTQPSNTLDAHAQNGSWIYYVGQPKKINGPALPAQNSSPLAQPLPMTIPAPFPVPQPPFEMPAPPQFPSR